MRVLSVVGARPQFVKLAPIADAFSGAVDHVIVHTGQHYDDVMSDVFFADLRIPRPDVNLGVGSGSHGVQTGAMLAALDGVLESYHPDWVLVYGDTNSTLAAAVAAVKLHIRVAHLEAGLRSFNRRMPEEHNRVLTDHAADLLLAPTDVAMLHLTREGLAERAVLVGDVMADVCQAIAARSLSAPLDLPDGLSDGSYVVATIHRAENTDDPERLRQIVEALQRLPVPVLLLAHPRLVARAAALDLVLHSGSVHAANPFPYPEMINVVRRSAGVVTDSGGLQKEAFLLGRPCTTLRRETEWEETLAGGWNVLAPDLVGLDELVTRAAPQTARGAPFGDGKAAYAVLRSLRDRTV